MKVVSLIYTAVLLLLLAVAVAVSAHTVHTHHHHDQTASLGEGEISLADDIYYIADLEKKHKGINFKDYADENGEVQVFVTFRSKMTPSDWSLVPNGEYVPRHTVSLLTNITNVNTLSAHPRVRHVAVLPHKTKFSTSLFSVDLDSQELLEDLSGLSAIEASQNIDQESKKVEALDFLVFPTQSAEILADKWANQIKESFPYLENIDMKAVSQKKIVAEFKFPTLESRMENREKLIDWIGQKHHVRHVQLSEEFHVESVPMTATQFVEEYTSNPKSLKYQNMLEENYAKLGVHSLSDVKQFWKLNITGRGHIVGVGDTGIDINHCMFKDSKTLAPKFSHYTEKQIKSRMPERSVADLIKTGHRKIAEYWALADGQDTPGGHGSHVVGVLAGSLEGSDNNNIHTGILPDAKLAFVDIGMADKTLRLPEDLAESYFPFMKKLGADISSHSWGNRNYGVYTLSAREIDYFMWKNPYTLAVFAAGNSGREGSATITAPGTAKNCLTVGSSEANSENFKMGIPLYSDLMRASVPCSKTSFIFSTPDFCGDKPIPCNSRKVVQETCDALKSGGPNAEEICCKVPFLNKICCSKFLLNKNLQELNKDSHEYSDMNVAVFSSRGPTVDGRIKPEILAIGQPIFSARAGGELFKGKTCPIPQVMQGTSQSTPLVAGYSVMLKEFLQTMYEQSTSNIKGAIKVQAKQIADYKQGKVMGSLLKAIIINAGSELKGVVDINGQGTIKKLMGFPSFTQGFGFLNLTTTMPFEGTNNFLFAHQESIETNQKKQYCFRTTKGQVKKATLVWTDYPASPSAKFTLVNNLDLSIQLGSGKEILGNNARPGHPDDINVVEQVILTESEEYIKVIVRGSDVPHGPQPFSLVVSGSGKTEVSEC